MRSRKKPEREVDEDLVTRTSWVNAELAYKHVKKVSQQPSPSPTRVQGNLGPAGASTHLYGFHSVHKIKNGGHFSSFRSKYFEYR